MQTNVQFPSTIHNAIDYQAFVFFCTFFDRLMLGVTTWVRLIRELSSYMMVFANCESRTSGGNLTR